MVRRPRQDNVPRARFREFKKEGLEIQKVGPEILGSRIVSDIAVVKDFDAEWVYDHQYFTSEVNVGAAYGDLFRAASELRYNIDIVGTGADFSRYKVVFAPYMILMDPGLAAKIRSSSRPAGSSSCRPHCRQGSRQRHDGRNQPDPREGPVGVELDSFMCYQPPSRREERGAVRRREPRCP